MAFDGANTIVLIVIVIIIVLIIIYFACTNNNNNVPYTFVNNKPTSQSLVVVSDKLLVNTNLATGQKVVNTNKNNNLSIQFGNANNCRLNFNETSYNNPLGTVFYLDEGLKTKVNIYDIPISQKINKITYINQTSETLTVYVGVPSVVPTTDLLTITPFNQSVVTNKSYLNELSRFVGATVQYCISDSYEQCTLSNTAVILSGNVIVTLQGTPGNYTLTITN